MQNHVPRTLTGIYRLFLRTSAAAVLHHVRARTNLRRRWRPTFDEATKIMKELQHPPSQGPHNWTTDRIEWLKVWNARIDHTLEILFNSATSRGLPHKLTRNLASIVGLEHQRLVTALRKLPRWQPQDHSIPEVPKPLRGKVLKKVHLQREQEELSDNSMHALDEIVRMAEASAGLSLGINRTTAPVRRRKPQ